MKPEAVVVGASAGGLQALNILLSGLPAAFGLPIIVVLHIGTASGGYWIDNLNQKIPLTVKEAEEKETIEPGHVYFAPPDYHLLIEPSRSFSLSVDAKVNYARPSIDVLFESAALMYDRGLIGVVLTGSNYDGAAGLAFIKKHGGVTIVQEPVTAASQQMPLAAIRSTGPDFVLPLEKISHKLTELDKL